ncbi:MAG: T9SS type A sorting domain-containing protein [Bacteroidota bacterium]
MRTLFTLFLSLFVTVAIAQNQMFVHTATAGNIASDASFIDHPDLNNNPDAELIVVHNWNPPGTGGVYNTNETGLFYNEPAQSWMVYNENGSNMIVGSSYNIYIGEPGDITLHIADLANQGSVDSYSVINHPDLNGNPNAHIALSTYYNPNGLRNDHPYGVWYDVNIDRWIIYSEDFAAIPLDTAFFVLIDGSALVKSVHRADAGNITGNYTTIDHPLLNNNPNAVFVYGHNWGVSGGSGNVIVGSATGAWYTGSNWSIFMEDLSAMPENAEFDLFIFDPTLSVEDNTIEGLTYYPNPVRDYMDISANSSIDNVIVFDVLGRQVLQQDGDQNTMKLNLASLTSGNYLAQITSENTVQVIKLIKE